MLDTGLDAPPLGARDTLVYSLLSFGCGAPHFLILAYFLKYGTGTLGIEPAVLGGLFGASRIWDAVSDPVVGALSDRLASRFGRRRPWLAAGGVLLAVSLYMLWSPLPAAGSPGLTVWVGGAICLYFTAHTLVFVPYDALAVELTRGLHARNRLYASRFAAYQLAMVAGVVATAAFTESASPRRVGSIVGLAGAALAVLGTWPVVARLREAARPVAVVRRARLWSGLRRAALDREARIFFVITFVVSAGESALSALGPFVVAILLGSERPLPLILAAYILSGLVTAPLVTRLADRFGTWRLWNLSLAVMVLFYGGLAFVHPGGLVIMMGLVIPGGVAAAFQGVLGSSILASLIDRSARRSGEFDEGAYAAVRTFVAKSAYGGAVMVAGFALSAAGYSAHRIGNLAGVAHSEVAWRAAIAGPPAAAAAIAFGLSFLVRAGRGVAPGRTGSGATTASARGG